MRIGIARLLTVAAIASGFVAAARSETKNELHAQPHVTSSYAASQQFEKFAAVDRSDDSE